MWKNLQFLARIFLIYFVLSIGSFLMLRTIVEYTSFRTDILFLRLKQDYLPISTWRIAFYIHVFSAVIALLAGFTQFSPEFLSQFRKSHRRIGMIYVVDILVINFPAGLIMCIYANGGIAGKTAFLLLDVLWFWFTWRAYADARARKFATHREFMIRSYALTFSAVTLRTWKIILSHTLTIDQPHLYIIDAWMGFIPNMLVAEWIIRTSRKVTTSSSGKRKRRGDNEPDRDQDTHRAARKDTDRDTPFDIPVLPPQG